jgi:hypothetical protein
LDIGISKSVTSISQKSGKVPDEPDAIPDSRSVICGLAGAHAPYPVSYTLWPTTGTLLTRF